MGKDKHMKMKKKKKEKENNLSKSPKKKEVHYSEEDSDDDSERLTDYNKHKKQSIISESPKKKSKYIEETFGSPKKKSKHTDEDINPYEKTKKKMKRDKEFSEDEYNHKKKSKKDKESNIVNASSKINFEESPSKKSKKNILKSSFHEESDLSDHEIVSKTVPKEKQVAAEPDIVTAEKLIEEETGWRKEDFFTLLENMANLIPDKDSLKYTSRIERLDWSQISFNNHTPEECKEKWKMVEKKVRGFRILREMVDDAKLWVEKPWSSFYSSHKKNRHPDMPRRPLTSYMLFYMAKKSKFSKKHPNLGLPDLSKIIADKFHKLSDSKKEKYVEQAKALREEYNGKMQKFLETHPNESMALKKNLKELKTQMPGPKRPLPPFKLFVEEKLKQFDEREGLSKAEFVAQVKEAWKNLSSKKKVHWIRWAHENEKKYLEELEIYKSENPNFEMPKIKALLSKEEVTILERMDGKPEKPPNSAYSLFSRLMLKDDQIKLMKFSPKDRMKEISRLWSAVSDEEKKQYQEKAKHLLEIYKLEYATYLESLPEDKRAEELAKSLGRKRKKKEPNSKGTNDNGKKLKQTKILDAFSKKTGKKEEENEKSASSDEENEDEEEDDSDDETEEDILNNPQKLKEIKKKIEALDPPKPCSGAFELFKEVYLTNPGNKESKASLIWESMPKKEKERYRRKLEAQKQNYILKYKEFLAKLKPHEIKVYYEMKNQESSSFKNKSSAHLSDSSEGEESDDEADDSSEEEHQVQANKSIIKTEDTSSSSEDSD